MGVRGDEDILDLLRPASATNHGKELATLIPYRTGLTGTAVDVILDAAHRVHAQMVAVRLASSKRRFNSNSCVLSLASVASSSSA